MKAKAETKQLMGALAKLATLPGANVGLSGNSIITIEADQFGGLRLCRTTVQSLARITCDADIEEDGKAVVPFLMFFNSMKVCEGKEVTLQLSPTELLISSGDGDGAVTLWPESEVIPVPPKLEGVELTLSHEEIMGTLKIAGAAASDDRSRPQFMGICFRKVPGAMSAIGCNGHRAHVARIAALVDRIDPEPGTDRDFGVLLPTEGVECAKKIFASEHGSLSLTLGRAGVQMDAGEISLRLPVSDDRMPFTEGLLNPNPEITFKVEREPFLHAARAVLPTSGDSSLTLRLDRSGVSVYATSTGARVQRRVKCESDGGGEFIIDGKYIVSLLECAEHDSLSMWIADKSQRIYYREGERDFLVMFRKVGAPAKPFTKQSKK